jgi:hypothetical protein
VTAIANIGAGDGVTGGVFGGSYLKIGVKDREGVLIGPYFDQVTSFVDREISKPGGCVFVHCRFEIHLLFFHFFVVGLVRPASRVALHFVLAHQHSDCYSTL